MQKFADCNSCLQNSVGQNQNNQPTNFLYFALDSSIQFSALGSAPLSVIASITSPPSEVPVFLNLPKVSLSAKFLSIAFSFPRKRLQTTMEKITDKIAALPPNANYFSLEFFPPKTQMVG